MLIVLVRSIILYMAVLIALRIMGKGEIAEMNSFDLVITFLLAEVASIPMENNNIPMIYAIASITGLTFMQIVISYFSLKCRNVSSFFCGKSSILINKGMIDYKELKKDRITIEELLEQLRINGYFSIKDVQYAILETDGGLSILPSPSYKSTPTKQYKRLPLSLILDGKVLKENLNEINKDEKWLLNTIKTYNIYSIKDVLICMIDENDKIFIQRK